MMMNFSDLSDLISNADGKVILDSNVFLDEDEEFSEGISLESDDLIIEGAGHTIDAKGRARIFTVSAKNVIIKNITLKGGFDKRTGGAISNTGDLLIQKSNFTGNNSRFEGGAIRNEEGTVRIEDSTFNSNDARMGGAIYNAGSRLRHPDNPSILIQKSNFTANSSSFEGGAICSRGGTVRIEDSTFNSNDARMGGAISNWSGLMRICNSVFTENRAGGGGAIDNARSGLPYPDNLSLFPERHVRKVKWAIHCDGNLCLAGCKFLKNKAYVGGAISNKSGKLSLYSSAFEKNEGYYKGGAILSIMAFTMSGCIFTENVACCGGAIYYDRNLSRQGRISLCDSKFLKNTARRNGGALYMDHGHLERENSTFDDNSPDDVFKKHDGT